MCLVEVIVFEYLYLGQWLINYIMLNKCLQWMYITCLHLVNMPYSKKVQFVRHITLGVNHP